MKFKRNHLLKYLYTVYMFLPKPSFWICIRVPCEAVIHNLPVDCISESNKIVAEKMRHMHRCCSLAGILSVERYFLLND